MNLWQRIILICTAAVIAAMVLFPPYVIRRGSDHTIAEAGYGFLFALPEGKVVKFPATVNPSTLIAQIVGTLIVGVLLYFAFRDGEKRL